MLHEMKCPPTQKPMDLFIGKSFHVLVVIINFVDWSFNENGILVTKMLNIKHFSFKEHLMWCYQWKMVPYLENYGFIIG